jgi:hypothetical protein
MTDTYQNPAGTIAGNIERHQNSLEQYMAMERAMRDQALRHKVRPFLHVSEQIPRPTREDL